jgi:NADPH-dependent ferric siderophore reductase
MRGQTVTRSSPHHGKAASGSLADDALPYILQARVDIAEPQNCLRHLCSHLKEDGVDIREDDGCFTVTLPLVTGSLRHDDGAIMVEATAADLESLYFVKMWLQASVSEMAGNAPVKIEWNEDCRSLALPPSFCTLTVVRTAHVTPRMRRITFRVNGIERFESLNALHLQILVNFNEIAARQRRRPDIGKQDAEAADIVPIWRRYTVRSVDRAHGQFEVDFFLHHTDGPGARWAEQARPGDMVGAAGPSGGGIGAADWYLIAGDETALPAIARILEALPETAEGAVFIEVAGEAERQRIDCPADITVHWLYRNACANDPQPDLMDVIADVDFPPTDKSAFVWVGCEARMAKKIRTHLRNERNLTKQQYLVVAYWHDH